MIYNPNISDAKLIEYAKEMGDYDNVPIDEAPISRGGSTNVRGKNNQNQINKFK